MHVFVLDRDRKPLTPCRMARARLLLKQGRAAVFRMFPFTIILKDRGAVPAGHEHRIKIDPGSKVASRRHPPPPATRRRGPNGVPQPGWPPGASPSRTSCEISQ